MENKIHVSQLKRINEVLEKIKTWKEFNFSDFTYQPELDMPEIPAFKVYLKADHESYFWFRYAVPHIDIKFSPTDNPLKTFEEIKSHTSNKKDLIHGKLLLVH